MYIREAHASDVWPLKFSHERPRPTSLAQRAAYAAECATELGFASGGMRVLCDSMDDGFNAAFGAWPTAYYLLDWRGMLLLAGEADEGDDHYDVRRFIGEVHRTSRALLL